MKSTINDLDTIIEWFLNQLISITMINYSITIVDKTMDVMTQSF